MSPLLNTSINPNEIGLRGLGSQTHDLLNSSNIFNKNINISIWKRKLTNQILNSSHIILEDNPSLSISKLFTPIKIYEKLFDDFDSNKKYLPLLMDVSELLNIFCKKFKLEKAWLRLEAISNPMCPRFHSDFVDCRMVTTYVGPGTEWLPNHFLDRSKLGHGNNGKSDEESGLYESNNQIEQLEVGHVALLKGEKWNGNKGRGLIHRSPQSKELYQRLYMTIDFPEFYFKIYRGESK